MRLYQMLMLVPDDFVPEQAEFSVTCKGEVKVWSEGFVGPGQIVEGAPADSNSANKED